jgi:putative restriction endonuclease
LDLLPGDWIYFKPKGTMTVAGRGHFREQLQLTLAEAWDRFGEGNGVASLAELAAMTKRTLRLADDGLNCLILDDLEILPLGARALLDIQDFPPGIMNCKFFEEGALDAVEQYFSRPPNLPALIGAEAEADVSGTFDPRFISTARAFAMRSICARRGQAKFRKALLAG